MASLSDNQVASEPPCATIAPFVNSKAPQYINIDQFKPATAAATSNAEKLIASGLSVVPIKLDGTKAPACAWKKFQTDQPTSIEVQDLFSAACGIGVVCGAVSGNLEVMDFDSEVAFDSAKAHLIEAGINLLDVLPLVKTPNGYHAYYRLEHQPEGNTKIAMTIDGKGVLVETRGQGGYVISPYSPNSVHPSDKGYELIQGDLTAIPTITLEEHDSFCSILRGLDERVKPEYRPVVAIDATQKRPGDEYNGRANWQDILCSAGWTQLGNSGNSTQWAKPGSASKAPHATTNYEGSDKLYVFSTSAPPFEHGRAYDKFSAYALLNHNGDFAEAAKALAKQGYGELKAKSDEDDEEKESKRNLADLFLNTLSDLDLFHDEYKRGFANVSTAKGKGAEAMAINNDSFKLYLRGRFFEQFGQGARDNILETVCLQLESVAVFRSSQRKVFTRVGKVSENVYIDLCNDDRQVIEITKDGWKVLDDSCPAMFSRSKRSRPLPIPATDGSIDNLWQLTNPHLSEEDKLMIVGFMIGSLNPDGPYAHLNIEGPPGSGKSTLTKMIKRLIDPSAAELTNLPKNEEDLSVTALNNWLLSYDNLESVPVEMSNSLARLSTGGGLVTRAFYSQREESVIDVQRPVLFNGIGDLARRPDLLSRCAVIELAPIESLERRTEREIFAEFDKASPAILGALYSMISSALSYQSEVVLSPAPRLADFATWVTAGLKNTVWNQERAFADAFDKNQLKGAKMGLEDNPLALAIMSRCADCSFTGNTATDVINVLAQEKCLGDYGGKSALPKANKLMKELNMIRPALKQLKGICIITKNSSRGTIYDFIVEKE